MKAEQFNFPAVKTAGKAIVRYFSELNPWLDFVVIVAPGKQARVMRILSKEMDEYWDQDDLCYGDMVEDALKKAHIRYEIVYHDNNREDQEYEDAWEEYLRTLYAASGLYEAAILEKTNDGFMVRINPAKINKEVKPVYTRDEAAAIVEAFDDILIKNNICIPSPEDDERDEDNMIGLYGTTYWDLVNFVEDCIQDILRQHKAGAKIVENQFSMVFGEL